MSWIQSAGGILEKTAEMCLSPSQIPTMGSISGQQRETRATVTAGYNAWIVLCDGEVEKNASFSNLHLLLSLIKVIKIKMAE
jgi:hypothetical protein